jgi:hypothetical protein
MLHGKMKVMAARKKINKHQNLTVGRRFFLKRVIDDSGVSGTGFVAVGFEWPSRKVTIEWVVGNHISQETHETIEDCMAIHGHGSHTVVEWVDGINLKLVT